MRYVCLIHRSDAAPGLLSDEDRRELLHAQWDYDEALRQRGKFVDAQILQPAGTATIVRMRDGCLKMSDGPLAETKTQVAGFLVIEARDLNDAIRLAAGMPLAKHGPVEIRPIVARDGTSLAEIG